MSKRPVKVPQGYVVPMHCSLFSRSIYNLKYSGLEEGGGELLEERMERGENCIKNRVKTH